MNTDLYDIVILGGGLVGSSLAASLATKNLKIALIEANPWLLTPKTQDARILALNHAAQQIFQALHLWPALAPHSTSIRQIHVSNQGYFGFTRLDSALLDLPALGYVIAADYLLQSLRQFLTTTAVKIFSPANLTALQQHTTHLELTITQKTTAEKTEKSKCRTPLLIIADGGNSPAIQWFNLQRRLYDYQQTALITQVTVEKPQPNLAFERFTATGPLAFLPMPENRYSVVWTVTSQQAEVMMKWPNEMLLTQLQQQFGWRLGRLKGLNSCSAYPLKLVQLQQSLSKRVVVIGNAAHTLHPVAGQGFNLGLRDAATLAEVLAHYSQQGEDLGNQTVLETYADYQRSDQQRVTLLTDGLVHLFSNHLVPLAITRNCGLLLLEGVPILKKALMQQMAGLQGYPSRLIRGLEL